MTKKSKLTEKNFFIKLYLWKKKYPIFTIIILSMTGVVTFTSGLVSKFFAIEILLIIFYALFLLLMTFTIFIQISDVRYKKYIKALGIDFESDLNFHISLEKNIKSVCNEKQNTLSKIISKVKNNVMEPPCIINDPNNQLRNLTSAVQKTFAKLLGMSTNNQTEESDLYVHFIYRFCDEDDCSWKYTDSCSIYEYEDPNELAKQKSQFKKCLDHKPYLRFANNKQKAFDNEEYICCEHDEYLNGKLCGSIAYYKMPITSDHGHKIIDLIAMIYSCKQRFAKDDNESVETAEYNIKTIMNEYTPRIKIELSLLYLEYLYNKKHRKIKES